MVEITNNIFEEDFNKSQTHTYNLSVLLGMDRLHYLVASQDNRILGVRTCTFTPQANPIQQILKEDTILNNSYRSVKVGLQTNNLTLLPTSIFREKEAADYLAKTTNYNDNEEVMSVPLDEDIMSVFSFPKSLLADLSIGFQSTQIYPVLKGLYANYKQNFDKTTRNVFLHVLGNTVQITVLQQQKLLFTNSFEFKASPDCLYFVLLAYKQLGINPQNEPLYVSGEIVEDSEIYKLLFKYIKTIKLVDRPNFYSYSNKLTENIPSNFFFDLYSLKLCE